ncbi:MAG TPA: serine protease [Saprospiraceae bacterium]|nr:serine protease [Saprospiraceae bacterium]HRP42948.1 serine protease [Saprospiraceae bacterium]
MKPIIVILFCVLGLDSNAQFDTSGPVNKQVINTVIEIQTGNETGSGFLVFLGKKRLLVTNKHMVGNWSPVDSLIYNDSIYIYPYTKTGFSKVGIKISGLGKPINSKIKVHPNQKVDIAVVDITTDIANLALDNTNFIDTTYFVKLQDAKSILTYGSQVFTIGYPAGVKAFKTNQPLIKSGYLASSLDGELVMEQVWVNRKGAKIKTLTDGKIFIVDGLIIPGNSGGPVILSQEVVWFEIGGQLKHLQNVKNYFIGIVSNIYTNTGLATIFSSDNILEVIRQFK